MTTGLTKDAGWQIGVSRTLDHPRDLVWATLTSPKGLATWLGPGAVLPSSIGEPYVTDDETTGELRSLRPYDRVRLTFQPAGREAPTTVQVAVSGEERTTLRFHQEHLASAEEREQQRAHWQAAMERVIALLA